MDRQLAYRVDSAGPSRPHSAVAMRTLVANTGTASNPVASSSTSFELEDLSDSEKGKVRSATTAFLNRRRARMLENRTSTDTNLMEMKRIDSRTSVLGVSTSQMQRNDSNSRFDMNGVVRKAMIFKKFLAENEERERQQREEENQNRLAAQVFQPASAMTAHNYAVVDVEPTLADDAELLVQDSASCQTYFIYKCKDFYMRARHACFSPMGRFYYFWTMLVSAGVFYNTIGMAMFVFAEVYEHGFWHWCALNTFFDVIFWLDIYVQTKKAYMQNGKEIHDPGSTRRYYFKEPAAVFGGTIAINGHEFGTRFMFDFISALPLDAPILFFWQNISLIRAFKILKAHRLFDFVEETQRRSPWPHITKILFLMSACYILFHLNACVYFDISNREGLTEDDQSAFGFSYFKVFNPVFPMAGVCSSEDYEACLMPENYETLDLDDERPKYKTQLYDFWKNKSYKMELGNFSREYSMSMYWSALTITTCGQQPYPTSSVQNILEVVDTLIGVLVFATIIGSVGSVVTNLNHQTYIVRKKLDNIKLYMQSRGVDLSFQKHIMHCFLYMNGQHQLTDESELLKTLPPRLQSELAVALHFEVLTQIPLFKDCSIDFLYQIMQKLKQQVYSPNNYLCEIGEKAKRMFIVKTGILRVLTEDGMQIKLLNGGETFGESSIVRIKGKVSDETYKVSVRTIGFADIYILSQDDVLELSQDYPEDKEIMLRNGCNYLLQESSDVAMSSQDSKDNRSPVEVLFEDFTEFMEDRRFLTVEEQLARAKELMVEIDRQLDQMYSRFTTNSQDMKRRVTQLEVIHSKHKSKIKADFLREEIIRRKRNKSVD